MLGGALENQSKSGSPRGAISWPTGGPSAVLSLPTPAALITSTRPESARLACLSVIKTCARNRDPALCLSLSLYLFLSCRDPALTGPQRDAASRQKPDVDRCRIAVRSLSLDERFWFLLSSSVLCIIIVRSTPLSGGRD